MRRFIFTALVLMVATNFAPQVNAQFSFENTYGSGLHAYFSGNYQTAYSTFGNAIELDNRDARAHYFRGLAATKIGLPGEADFLVAAKIEMEQGGRLSSVNEALERIQGELRIKIENIRRNPIAQASYSTQMIEQTFPIGSNQIQLPAEKKVPSPVTMEPDFKEVTSSPFSKLNGGGLVPQGPRPVVDTPDAKSQKVIEVILDESDDSKVEKKDALSDPFK